MRMIPPLIRRKLSSTANAPTAPCTFNSLSPGFTAYFQSMIALLMFRLPSDLAVNHMNNNTSQSAYRSAGDVDINELPEHLGQSTKI